ncbi:TPA: hypothetical protein ACH3X1_004682 [Trebouxia sp. C0004]
MPTATSAVYTSETDSIWLHCLQRQSVDYLGAHCKLSALPGFVFAVLSLRLVHRLASLTHQFNLCKPIGSGYVSWWQLLLAVCSGSTNMSVYHYVGQVTSWELLAFVSSVKNSTGFHHTSLRTILVRCCRGVTSSLL